MRLLSTKISNVARMRGETTLDLETLDGQLVAITGANGIGKSTGLGSAYSGALFRAVPEQGSMKLLREFLNADKAFVESIVDYGTGPTTIRHTFTRTTQESFVRLPDGSLPIHDGKVTTFDAWAKQHLPGQDVFFASVYSAQASQGLLDMTKGERKAVILRFLQLERYEAMATQARRNADTDRGRAEIKKNERRTLLADSRPIEELEQAHADAVRDVETQTTRRDTAQAALQAAKDRHAEAVAAFEDADRAKRKYDEAAARKREASRRQDEAQTRLDACVELIRASGDIEARAIRLDALEREQAELREKLNEARAALQAARNEVRRISDQKEPAESTVRTAQSRMDRARSRLSEEDAVRAAAESIPGLEGARKAAAEHVETAKAEVERVRGDQLGVAEKRIGEAVGTLNEIVTGPDDAAALKATAQEGVDADVALLQAAATAPTRLREAQDELRHRERALREIESELSSARIKADRLAGLEEARRDHDEAKAEHDAATQKIVGFADEIAGARRQQAEAQSSVDNLESAARDLAREIADLAGSRELAQDVQNARAVEGELRQRLEELSADTAEAERLLLDCPPPPTVEPVADIRAEEYELGASQRDLEKAQRALAKAESALEQGRKLAERVAKIDAELAEIMSNLADWTRLGRDLGRDGLQALIIDAAGPELTTTINELLEEAYGTRYVVEIETTRAKKSGDGEREVFDVTVHDSHSGYRGPATGLSGGQRVIVSTALRFALIALACRRAGWERPTIVIDEGGAALDRVGAAAKWVVMLRKAARLIGAHRVLVVTHSVDVENGCDCVIEVKDGAFCVKE